MKRLLLTVPFAAAIAAPAHATGGLVCRTAGGDRIEVALGFGHVPGSPLILTRLRERGREVPVSQAQWWLDDKEMRVLLISPQAQRREVEIRARRNGHFYDGSLWRGGVQRWVRCKDD